MLCSCGHSLLPSTHAPVGFEGTRPHGVPPTSGSSCTASFPFSSSQLWRVSALGPGLPLRLSPHSALRGSHPVRGFKCHRRADCPLGLRPPGPPPCSHRFLVLVGGSVARTSHRRLRHSRPKGESLPRSERLLGPTASNQFSRLKVGGHPWFRCFLPLLPPPPHLMTHQLILPSAVLTDVSAPSTSLGLSYHCHLRGEHLKPCPPHLCSGDLGIFHWKSRFALDAASVGLLQGKPD